MKKTFRILLIITTLSALALAGHLYYLTTLSAKETYPNDNFLNAELNKTALIIVAHDDDMVGSCGTITGLCKAGWNIREMCFYQQGGLYAQKDSIKNPIRKRDLKRVAAIQGLAGTDVIDFNFRKDMEKEESYLPMPYAKFPENFKEDSLRTMIAAYIQKYKPSVIFTLDDRMGGYGNPDHVVISQLISEYCKTHKEESGFSVKRIYQAVFPPSLAENVLGNMPVYAAAKEKYQCSGMPLPDVQINISAYGELKKECFLAYTTEQNSIKKIWPYYNWYPASVYFKIFDRDFFRVLDVNNL